MSIRFLTFTLCLLFTTSSSLAEKVEKNFFPHGCRQTGFEFTNQKLSLFRESPTVAKSQDETLYFVFNKTHDEIILQTDADSRYLPNYKKHIPPEHWAVFSRTDPQLEFSCLSTPRFENDLSYTLDCYETIALCNYNHVKFPNENLGTYWLQSTTPNQRTMMEIAIHKGILLRW